MKQIRFILFPVALLYGLLVSIHRLLHEKKILTQKGFPLPIITIGNLSVGGTGKSPHVEFFHRLLSPDYTPAIVSRGYHRRTKGVQVVQSSSTAIDVGDEPLQFKLNFPNTTVVVAERRVLGVERVLNLAPTVNCILLDDAFQHWGIRSTTEILLTTFDQPFFDDWVVPMGRLREFRKGYKRARIIIVTKCQSSISEKEKAVYLQKINPQQDQQVFFSYFKYQAIYDLFNPLNQQEISRFKTMDVVVVTGIADTTYLETFLEEANRSVTYLRFPDHHHYQTKDVEKIKRVGKNKLIITTQKDAVKLSAYQTSFQELILYVLPIQVKIAFGEEELLKEALLNTF